ncbi:MAG TPA: phosphatase PAP2 family protein [Thermoguttaceae bacterium]|nr:phosphatase PAP2 family protein [Thermoguttaceae bacterium]
MRRPRVPGGWMLVGLMVLVGVASLTIDARVSQWCKTHHLPSDVQAPIDWAEVFGHGTGVAILLLTVWVLDPARRRSILRVALLVLLAGTTVNLIKSTIARARPRVFDFEHNIWQSFGDYLSLGAGGSDCQSFPSGHVAVAVGLALGLGWLYPRGRFLFLIFAAMVAAQRVTHCSHFCSDAFFGAAIGCASAVLLLDVGPLARWFDRKEDLEPRVKKDEHG